jgi:tripartite-type tricarboxylate transporter receptor subunit TctC
MRIFHLENRFTYKGDQVMKPFIRALAAAVGSTLILGWAAAASAQSYPNRPIRIIVPAPPGGTTDALARIVGQKLTESWGQAVVIDNRAGASGIIAAELTAKAPADGYTLLLATSTTLATNTVMHSKLPYNPKKDFSPVSVLVTGPNLLVVHPSVPAKSVKELIALAKSKPGKLTYATTGNGTSQHLSAELFKSMAGVDLVHVPYKGSGPAHTDLLSGRVDVMFENMPTALPHVQSGALRALAVTNPKRWPTLPDIPAVGETVPGYEIVAFYGVVAPAGTPAEIVKQLNVKLKEIITASDIRDRLHGSGFLPSPTTPEEFRALIDEYTVKNAKVIKESGASID